MTSQSDVEIDISGEIEIPEDFNAQEKPGLLMSLPANLQLASPDAREWIQKRRENVRPWLVFFATSKFKPPSTVPRCTKRVMKNIDYFQSNYVFVFLGLIIYCLITSPLLLIAIAGSLGTCTYLSRRNTEKKIIIGGNEVSLVQQYTAVAVLSIPLFYIAGAGSILFWVLGASFFLIAIHATMYNIESVLGSDDEPFDLQMEEV